MRTKTSQPLPSEEKSMLQAMKHVRYQVMLRVKSRYFVAR